MAIRQAMRWALALCLALPLQIAVAEPLDWRKVGEARLTVMVWDVYDSTLFTPDGAYRDGQRPVRLDLRYLRDIDSAKLVSNTASEWDKQGIKHPHRQAWLEEVGRLWPDIQRGDQLSLVIDAAGTSSFFRNGDPLGGIADPAFGEHFIGIWLSPKTTRPELRLALLGGE